ncbi:MAG: AMP-binding protein [Mycobacteriaceae bacterium]|nr:AMP-binding protein [Mycobacteriaceae bacterium]
MISDVVDFALRVQRTRSELWHLLATPQWYPRFFRGIGAVTRIVEPGQDSTEAFAAQVGGGPLPVSTLRFRIREYRREAEFAIEGIDSGWFGSVRLTDDPKTGGTRISAAMFRVALAHERLPELDNSAITEWLHAGITRVVEYLDGTPTAVADNTRNLASLQISIVRQVFSSGVVSAFDAMKRPDRGLRQLNSLYRWGFTLAGGYAAATAHSPTDTAIIDDVGAHSFERVHYRSNWIAAGMHNLGIRDGAAIGILARNHAAMVETLAACGKLGVEAVMVNTGLSPRQIEELSHRNNLSAVFLDDEFDELVRELPGRVLRIATRPESVVPNRITLQELVGEDAWSFPRPQRHGRQIVLTSGTSGSPKAAVRPHPRGFGTVAAMLSKLPLQLGERMLIAAPLFHSWGFGLLQIATPVRATVVLQDRFDPEECLAAVSRYRCTSLMVVPIMLQRLLDLPPAVRARYDTSSLRVIASCGSPLPGRLAHEVMDAFGDVLYNFYGSTEVSWATVADPADLRAAPATAGTPPLGTRVAILDPHGAVMPLGAVGRVFVGNDMLFDGYTNADSPAVADGLMDTGDLGYLVGEGRLFLCGRDDEMIISGGENVFPRPVEDALAMLPEIQEVAVIGVPDQEFGQRLAAFVVPHLGATVEVEWLRRYIRDRLNRFSVPRDFTFLDALPRSATGKILKRVLARGDFDFV